jgi:hypothetical protein
MISTDAKITAVFTFPSFQKLTNIRAYYAMAYNTARCLATAALLKVSC